MRELCSMHEDGQRLFPIYDECRNGVKSDVGARRASEHVTCLHVSVVLPLALGGVAIFPLAKLEAQTTSWSTLKGQAFS